MRTAAAAGAHLSSDANVLQLAKKQHCLVGLTQDWQTVVHLRRKLCGECGKLPHPGADCAAAAAGAHLSSDADVLKLAEEKHWRQCPKCRCMVERLVRQLSATVTLLR